MISLLDRKLLRDLDRMKGQAIAVALVMACGLAMMIMARSLIFSLESSRKEYYEANRFAEIFTHAKRAPNWLALQIGKIPGVGTVQAGLSVQVTLDIPGLDEPASGQIRSLPDFEPPQLNRLHLRKGQCLPSASRRQVLVSEAFAQANDLQPGDHVAMLLNGRRQDMQISGIVLSPEFIFEARPGAALPDNRSYGIFWMPYQELAAAYNLDGAFNYLSLTLAPGAKPKPVISQLDRLLEPYGSRGAYGRADHPSHIRVSDEIRVLQTMAIGFPLVFLSVAAFMTHAVLSRLLSLQREQIAILKAFGFANRQISVHYLKYALFMVMGGTILGCFGGLFIGHKIVDMYHMFFRFPNLNFRLDYWALCSALVFCSIAALGGVLSSVRRAAKLPPAEAMRPEPPARYRPALVERTGISGFLSHTFRIAVRNVERKPLQALFTIAGLSLATGILIVPNAFRDGVKAILEFQWDIVQRSDISIGLTEPSSLEVVHSLEQMPAVLAIEPFRSAAVRIHYGHRHRQLMVQGYPLDGLHNRVVNSSYKLMDMPSHGILISSKLAEVLGARVGEQLTLEFLEGKRPRKNLTLVGLSEDFAGVAAFMEIKALNRLLVEGDIITGASFKIDSSRKGEFLRSLKEVPKVSWVAIKDSLRNNFRKTTGASIGLIQNIYMTFAIVVAFGVVYNSARISLAERARELATLRVIGFSRREVGAVLVTELVILALIAVPLGLWVGKGFATVIISQVNTETVRVPLVLTASNYAYAVLVVTVASTLSALYVLRMLNHLNLVSALKAPE